MENELREILFDAIEQTRKRVEQRRNHQQRSEQYQKKSGLNSSAKPTLRYSDFRPYDKQQFVEAFVSNPSILSDLKAKMSLFTYDRNKPDPITSSESLPYLEVNDSLY